MKGLIVLILWFAAFMLFVTGIISRVENVYDERYMISEKFNGCLVVDKNDNFFINDTMEIMYYGDKIEVFCTGIHFKEYNVGDTLKTRLWGEK